MKIISFDYGDKTYNVNLYESLSDRIQHKELLELPIAGWIELLKVVNGKADFYDLQYVLINKIKAYDVSSNVNGFTFHGIDSWLDKDTRVGLMNLANCSTEDIELVLEGEVITINPETLKKCLMALEVYAGKCYATTQKHLIAVNKIETVEDLINYNYTLGYPNKLVI